MQPPARLITCSAIAVCLAACLSSATSASVRYRFVTDAPAYELSPDETTDVNVYLEELLTGSDSSELVARQGLFSFDAALDAISVPGSPSIAVAAAANPAFNGAVTNFPPMILIADRSLSETTGVLPIQSATDTYRLHLGAFTIQAGDVFGETTLFNIGDFENPQSPGADSNTFYWDDTTAATPLDSDIAPTSFSVTVVPEPGALALATLASAAALWILLARRCKNK